MPLRQRGEFRAVMQSRAPSILCVKNFRIRLIGEWPTPP